MFRALGSLLLPLSNAFQDWPFNMKLSVPSIGFALRHFHILKYKKKKKKLDSPSVVKKQAAITTTQL